MSSTAPTGIGAQNAMVRVEMDGRYIAGLQAAVERVRALCASRMTEGADGAATDVDSLWPSEVLAALNGASEEE